MRKSGVNTSQAAPVCLSSPGEHRGPTTLFSFPRNRKQGTWREQTNLLVRRPSQPALCSKVSA